MSHGGIPIGDTPIPGETQGPAGPLLHELIRQGRSFSGHEPHCCFLNLGDGQFADISPVSGLDFPDDGRAVARVDWDQDGDLDVWIANRSGPQVRFLRNDVPQQNHFLVVHLEGRTCNRDAIGARVELKLKGQDAPLLRTVSAGDGFLAQSSKAVHFGLGDATQIERVMVRWPTGTADIEEFSGLQVDGHYRLVQHSGQATRLAPPRQPRALARSRLVEPAASDQAHVFSASQLPLPQLEYETFAGQRRLIQSPATSRPVVLNLWASWCTPCLQELQEWSQHADQLRSAGVDVVAISVDGLEPGKPADKSALQDVLQRIGFPFAAGMAPAATVEKLQMVQDHLFEAHRPLPVPTTYLIDQNGILAATYKGRVDRDQLIADVRRVSSAATSERALFPGRWHFHREALNPFHLVWKLVERGFLDEALDYIDRYEALLAQHYHFHKLLVLAGNGCLARGEAQRAAALYREALDIVPSYGDAQNNLAWLLATRADDQLRNGEEAVRLAEAAVQSGGQHPSLLDTLAAAYAEAGRFEEAVATANQATELASSRGQRRLAEKIKARLLKYEADQAWRD